jgi:hypothetical protein
MCLWACRPLLVIVLTATAAHAASFASLSQTRSIAIAGQMTLFSLDSTPPYPINASLADGAQTAPADFGTFNASVGLGALRITDPLGEGFGAGRAGQVSSFSAQSIRFEGAADVNLTGFAQPEAEITGNGSASSRLIYSFSLDRASTVALTMSSEVGPSRSSYSFLLADLSGTTVWDQTSLFDANGNETRDFTTLLTMGAGSYNLAVVLGASSTFRNDESSAGRAIANFVLSPVPEPSTALQAALALTLLGGWMRLRRKS